MTALAAFMRWSSFPIFLIKGRNWGESCSMTELSSGVSYSFKFDLLECIGLEGGGADDEIGDEIWEIGV